MALGAANQISRVASATPGPSSGHTPGKWNQPSNVALGKKVKKPCLFNIKSKFHFMPLNE